MIFNLQMWFKIYSATSLAGGLILLYLGYQISQTKTSTKESSLFNISTIFFTLLFYAFFLMSSSYKNAMIMYTLFLCMTDWVVYTTFTFTINYTNTVKKVGFVKQLFYGICFFDSASILSNPRTGHLFDIVPRFTSAGYFFWNPVFFEGNVWHRFTTTIILLATLAILLISIIRAPSYGKIKYAIIAGGTLIVLLVSYVCLELEAPISLSLITLLITAVLVEKYVKDDFSNPLLIGPLEAINETIPDVILCFSADGRLSYHNTIANRVFDKSNEQLEDFSRIFTKLYLRQKSHRLTLLDNKNEPHEYIAEYKDFYVGDSIAGSYLRLQDKTKEIRKSMQQQHKATHDSLTGLLNRSGFFDKMQEALENNRFKIPVMICTNIKDFKLINTLYGNKYGDEVLKTHAKVIMKLGHKKSIIGRMADDKFTILMEKSNFHPDVFEEAFKELSTIGQANMFNLRICAGIYEIYNKKENIQLIYDKAKISLDAISDDTQQIFSYYDSSMLDRMIAEKNIVNEFDTALSERQFSIELQPVNDLDGRALGAEAFVRWSHPEYQTIKPEVFISILEKTGLIYKLDAFVWNLAAKKLRDWKEKGLTDKFISVNVSGKDKYFIDVPQTFTDIVKKFDISPENLRLEVSETDIMKDSALSIEIFQKLKALGFKIYIDRFGTGYSSLNMLKDFIADGIKMDTTFLAEDELSEKDKIILQTMISMTDSLGMTFVAKGVESKNHLKELSEMGCKYFQGYYFSHPLQIHDFETIYLK